MSDEERRPRPEVSGRAWEQVAGIFQRERALEVGILSLYGEALDSLQHYLSEPGDYPDPPTWAAPVVEVFFEVPWAWPDSKDGPDDFGRMLFDNPDADQAPPDIERIAEATASTLRTAALHSMTGGRGVFVRNGEMRPMGPPGSVVTGAAQPRPFAFGSTHDEAWWLAWLHDRALDRGPWGDAFPAEPASLDANLPALRVVVKRDDGATWIVNAVAAFLPLVADADAQRAFYTAIVALVPEGPSSLEDLGAEGQRDLWQFIDEGLAELLRHATGTEKAEEVQVPVSPRTQALARRFDRLAIEHTVARSPVSLTIKGKPASAEHKMIVNFWTKRYAERGCPSDGVVEVSFTEWGQLFGYPDDMTGRYYELIRDRFRDFRSAGVSEEWLQKGHRAEVWFAIIQGYGVTEKDSMTRVQLSAALQTSIRRGAWSYLDPETWRQLHQASPHSDVAELLWMWLETETLPFRWRVFAAPEGKRPKRGDIRCVAERLNLHGKYRRKTVALIRAAARLVMDVCPWYQIRVESADGVGMWNLVADRQAAIETPDAPTNDAGRDGTNAVRGTEPTRYAGRNQRGTRGLPDDGKKVLHARKEDGDLRISSPSCFLPFCFLPFLKAQDGGENAAAQESKTEEETVDWLVAFPEAIREDEELWQLLVAVLGDHTAALFRTVKRGHAATVKRLLGDVCAFTGQAMGAVDCETRRPACRAAVLHVLNTLAKADEPIKLAQAMLNTANGLGSYVPEDLIERCRMIDRNAPVSAFAEQLAAALSADTSQVSDASLEDDDG